MACIAACIANDQRGAPLGNTPHKLFAEAPDTALLARSICNTGLGRVGRELADLLQKHFLVVIDPNASVVEEDELAAAQQKFMCQRADTGRFIDHRAAGECLQRLDLMAQGCALAKDMVDIHYERKAGRGQSKPPD